MKFKMKKFYWFYLFIILFLCLLFWLFTRSIFADSCSMDLNTCLLKSKQEAFFPRLLSGLACTFKNLGCLISHFF